MSIRLLECISTDVAELYNLYSSGEYPEFFRHFEEGMKDVDFRLYLLGAGYILAVNDNNNTIGYYLCRVHKKEKIVDISLIIKKEYQQQKKAFNSMIQLCKLLIEQGARRLACYVSSKDERTIKILKDGHFKEECRLRKTAVYEKDGKTVVCDDVRLVMTSENFEKEYLKGE